MQKTQENNYRSYVSLLSMNHQRIYNFILMLVANHNDAEEIMQETSIVMFEKFNTFTTGTDFLAWAQSVAKYQILNFLKKKKREKIVFNQEIVDLIDQEGRGQIRKQDEWLEALRKCVSKLSGVDRQLLYSRYHGNVSAKTISSRMGCSFQKVYRNISRINHFLVCCVRQKVQSGEI